MFPGETAPRRHRIEFSATDRQTKRLVELENLQYGFDGRMLFTGLNFVLTAGTRIGLVGPNGSGKTTLLRLLRGEIEPLKVGSNERPRCVPSTSIRIAFWNQTSRSAALWLPIAIR